MGTIRLTGDFMTDGFVMSENNQAVGETASHLVRDGW
jgi:hypothetical protein